MKHNVVYIVYLALKVIEERKKKKQNVNLGEKLSHFIRTETLQLPYCYMMTI